MFEARHERKVCEVAQVVIGKIDGVILVLIKP